MDSFGDDGRLEILNDLRILPNIPVGFVGDEACSGTAVAAGLPVVTGAGGPLRGLEVLDCGVTDGVLRGLDVDAALRPLSVTGVPGLDIPLGPEVGEFLRASGCVAAGLILPAAAGSGFLFNDTGGVLLRGRLLGRRAVAGARVAGGADAALWPAAEAGLLITSDSFGLFAWRFTPLVLAAAAFCLALSALVLAVFAAAVSGLKENNIVSLPLALLLLNK